MTPTAAVTVFTDGACSGNPGPGGWAWAVAPDGQPHGSGGDPQTTNQRMELTAVLEALRALGVGSPTGAMTGATTGATAGRIELVSDSTYVLNCFRDRWYVKWRANGWRNAKREPVANRDLWAPLVELAEPALAAGTLTLRWVKGHSGDPMNDLVDRLAVAAIPRAPRNPREQPPAGPSRRDSGVT